MFKICQNNVLTVFMKIFFKFFLTFFISMNISAADEIKVFDFTESELANLQVR